MRKWIVAVACVLIAAAVIVYVTHRQDDTDDTPDFGPPVVAQAPDKCGIQHMVPSTNRYIPTELTFSSTKPTPHFAPMGAWHAVRCSQLAFDVPSGHVWTLAVQARGEFSCMFGMCRVQLGLRNTAVLTATCIQRCQSETIVAEDTYSDRRFPDSTRGPKRPSAEPARQKYTIVCNVGKTCGATIEISAKLYGDTTWLMMDDLSVHASLSL